MPRVKGITETSKPSLLEAIFASIVMFGLFFVVMPAAIWAFLISTYYFWTTVFSWVWLRV